MFFQSITNERIVRVPNRKGMLIVHKPNEIPTGKGHWAGGRFDSIDKAFDFMTGLGAGRGYAIVVEFNDGQFGVWMIDKE